MAMKRYRRYAVVFAAVAIGLCAGTPRPTRAQGAGGTLLDEVVAPGNNYDKAEFRMWAPSGVPSFDAVLVLVPGSNGDGRSMAEDKFWQDFATQHKLAIVACRLTDKPHDQSFIEHYVNVSQGSGQALLDVLGVFARRSTHPELANAPLLFWGMSAGGEFNYEFVAWKPERVIAFVVNKGGIYYTALASQAARSVPGILFTGEKDLETRVATITGLFAVNRRAGALWSLAQEPGAAHVVGRSRDMGAMFFEDVLPLRLGGSGGVLRLIAEKDGFVGDLKSFGFQPAATASTANTLTVWLPTERVARGWQAVVTGKPF
jgi:poly(3-hydroxybutyrate) depolymerase